MDSPQIIDPCRFNLNEQKIAIVHFNPQSVLISTRLKGFSPNRGKRLEGLGVLQGLGALEAGGLVVLGGLG